MDRFLRELATLTPNQWIALIALLVLINMIVVGGLVWLVADEFSTPPLFSPAVRAQAVATRTPRPTFTTTPDQPTPAPFPTSTNTLVPTWTPSITPTPPPTHTPLPTETPTETPAPVITRVFPTATPTPTPTPDVDFVATIRQLTPCENQGKHHIFIYVRDQAGAGIPNIQLRVWWPGGEAFVITGDKIEDPGLTDFAMFKGSYFVEVAGFASDVVGPISPDIPQDETCAETGNPVANSLYHYSFEVIFTKVR
ncbi:MAG: hypothetical protein ACE5H9_00125 [Anaerolineae bacterium]